MWVCYNVSSDDPVLRMPRAVPNNVGGIVDREVGFWNYHYVYRGRGYVPYCGPVSVSAGRNVYYRGFSMIVPPGLDVVAGDLRIGGSGSVWGFFVYRFEGLFDRGSIIIGGDVVRLYRDPLFPRPFWDMLFISLVFFVVDKWVLRSRWEG